MSIPLVINGQTFQYPEVNDVAWGPDATDWAVAVTSGMLQKSGGLFILLDDVDFGATYGLISKYFTSRTANAADAGVLRLAVADTVSWRNNANTNNLALGVNGSDELTFNGSIVGKIVTVSDTATIDLTLTAGNLTAAIVSGSITNSLISNSAAIDYSKLALTGDIVNTDISSSAAIDYTKLAALTASRALQSSAGGAVEVSSVTSTELGYVSGVTSAIQTQLNAKQATGNYITALTGDVTASGPGSVAATIANNAVSNAKLATMPTLTIKGNNTGGTANALDLTVAQVNTMLGSLSNPMTNPGEMIYGGASGVATVVAAGTSGQYLKSNGTSAPTFTSFTAPTVQRFTSGSGTYTTPAGVLYIKVTAIGGGGGGAGSATIAASNATAGGTGGNTTFGSTLLVANGGGGGGANAAVGGTGGSASISGPTTISATQGNGGGGGFSTNASTITPVYGGTGGASIFGGAARPTNNGTPASPVANSGAGGNGAGGNQPLHSGSGGGAGGLAIGLIGSPSASYAYSVGTAGSAGAAGTGGAAGSAGAAGIIIVEEFYQ